MSELITQYFDADIGIEDMKLLVDVVEGDEEASKNMAGMAQEKWAAFGRGEPAWPGQVKEPSLGRKAMSRLYIFFAVAAVLTVALVWFAFYLSPEKHAPHWSEPLELQPVRATRFEVKDGKPKRPSKPAEGKNKKDEAFTQQGPVIKVHQSTEGKVTINLYTLDGEEVRKGLFSSHLKAGVWDFPWDGLDRYSRKVQAGVYRVEVLRPGKDPRKFLMRISDKHLEKM